VPRAAAKAIAQRRASARADLHLVSNDGDAELYVARSARAKRPRRIDPERVAKDAGRELKRLRRNLRVTVEEAARETRIAARYLEALESNAASEAFPAAAYARAFLREYALYLRVDPEPFLAAHPATAQPPEPAALSGVLPPAVRQPRRKPRWIVTAVLATVLLSLLVSTGSRGNRPTRTDASPAAHASVGLGAPGPGLAADAPPPSSAADPVPASGVAVELRAVGGSCWMRAIADGKLVSEQTLRPGATFSIRGVRRVDLVLGNAGAARLVVNGRPFDLGSATGRVLTVHLVLENGAVKIHLDRRRN